MKILVLALGARAEPYPALMRAQRETWASAHVEDVETLFYLGGHALTVQDGELLLPVSDELRDVGRKTLAAFEWAVSNRDFDLVFRTNSSSYVDLINLRQYAHEHGRDCRFYGGFLGLFDKLPFASGSGYFLSRDLVELVLEYGGEWRHDWDDADDAALADVLARRGVTPEPAPRVDYRSPKDARWVDTSQYHFRCRTWTRERRGDIRVMRIVHRAFCDARGVSAPRRGLADRLLRR
jgi:hypothetical protein